MNPISNDEVKNLGASLKGKTVYLIEDHNEFPAGTAFTVKASMNMPSRLTYKYLLTMVPEDPSNGTDKLVLDNGSVSLSRDGAAPAKAAPAAEAPSEKPAPAEKPQPEPAPVAPAAASEFELAIPDDPEMEAAQRFLAAAPVHPLSQAFWDVYENVSGPFDSDPLNAVEAEYKTDGKPEWTLEDTSKLYFGYCKANEIAPEPVLYEVNKQLEAQRGAAAAEKPKGKGGRPPGAKNKPKEAEAPQPEFRAAEPAQVVPFPTSAPPIPVTVIAIEAAPIAAELLKAASGGHTFEELAAAAVVMAKAAFAATAR